jgi:TfoX/Sxy family transcriptional regulator of competence genes
VLFLLRRLGHVIIFILFIAIIGYGFIRVGSEITPYVKDKSAVKVYYTAKPFDVTVDIGDYIIYINDKVFKNIKNFIEEL